MAIPLTSCTCERIFPKFIIVKTKLRSTVKQERLDGLLTLFIQQKLSIETIFDVYLVQIRPKKITELSRYSCMVITRRRYLIHFERNNHSAA
jgi:hypothetical protein